MNPHPYLRAYLAGIFAPSLGLLVALSVFIVGRLVFQIPVPIERVIIFPMALVPNLFGLWNIFYLWTRPHRHLPIGFHGALLPLLMVPMGALAAFCSGFLAFGNHDVIWLPGDPCPLFCARALVHGHDRDLLPCVEVRGGILQPDAGNRMKHEA
jgi:hypothetical protein